RSHQCLGIRCNREFPDHARDHVSLACQPFPIRPQAAKVRLVHPVIDKPAQVPGWCPYLALFMRHRHSLNAKSESTSHPVRAVEQLSVRIDGDGADSRETMMGHKAAKRAC